MVRIQVTFKPKPAARAGFVSRVRLVAGDKKVM